jgi:hypothetical protein
VKLSTDISTGKRGLLCRGALLFKKAEQTRHEGPEAKNGLARHHLVVIAAQEILHVLEVGLHFPADGQDIYQGLRRQVHPVPLPVPLGFEGAPPDCDRLYVSKALRHLWLDSKEESIPDVGHVQYARLAFLRLQLAGPRKVTLQPSSILAICRSNNVAGNNSYRLRSAQVYRPP